MKRTTVRLRLQNSEAKTHKKTFFAVAKNLGGGVELEVLENNIIL